jgi:hypothetical protein
VAAKVIFRSEKKWFLKSMFWPCMQGVWRYYTVEWFVPWVCHFEGSDSIMIAPYPDVAGRTYRLVGTGSPPLMYWGTPPLWGLALGSSRSSRLHTPSNPPPVAS